MPIFTVITANFNSGHKLSETAASLLEEDEDFEYIIIDGVSTDGSLDLARGIAAADPQRVRLISEPDRGIYDAMNKGVRAASGRYLFFLGAGDRLLPGALKEIRLALPSHDRGFFYGDVLWMGKHYDGPFDWRKLFAKNICHQSI